jgi:hypothetical protein
MFESQDLQQAALNAATLWPTSTGLLVFGIGALCGLQGFRFARFFLAGSTALAGFAMGGLIAGLADLPPLSGAWAGAGTLGVLSLVRFRVGVYLGSLITFTVLGLYLAARLELTPDARLAAGGIGFVIGSMAPYAFGRSAPIVITSVQGGILMILGFVSIASNWAPSLAATFVEWSGQVSFLNPMLLTMAFVLGFSVQSNLQQGDISTGGTFGDLHHEER